MMNLVKYIILITTGTLLLTAFSSCKKLVEIPPPDTELVQQLVFAEDATANAAMAGVYNKMAGNSWLTSEGSPSVSVLASLYADEMRFFTSNSSGSITSFYINNVIPTEGIVSNIWGSCYNLIYTANRIIEGLDKSTGVSSATKQQLKGECLFIRAFCHFYLVNLFGDVPYITTSDYITNTKVSRTDAALVYQGIVADLLEAKNILSDTYPGTGKRVRMNKGAAAAMLARAYLYTNEYAKAEAQSTEVMNSTSQYELLPDLNSVFLKNSKEAIWQLMPYGTEDVLFTGEGAYFILLSTPTNKSAISDQLWNAFETNDQRKQNWTDTVFVGLSSWYYPYKYKATYNSAASTEYSMVLRLGEQYLIRAEARAKQNKLSEAAADINTIRHRAGLLNDVPANSQAQLMAAIEQERQVELFTEWGHRFFDLKRWGRLDAVLWPLKSGWNTTDRLLPIPQSELLVNGNLTQNEGY